MLQGYINHVGLVLDCSLSMKRLLASTIQVADLQIKHLAERSQELDQETRATVYQFGWDTECLYYDKDVLRLPSIANRYKIAGNTALIDATLKAITDLKQTATLYGDHAFLIYVLTDGQENASKNTRYELKAQLANLPDNWTIAVFVPDKQGVLEAKSLGFTPGNIAVWDTSEQGIREVGETIRRTTDAYMHSRTQGMRSTSGLFQLGVENLTPASVHDSLLEVPRGEYATYLVFDVEQISDFVTRNSQRAYRKGSAFYQLTKPETVQISKQVVVRERDTHKVYMGRNARVLLGLPDYEVKVSPAQHPQYDIFVQSTSTNRKLVPGTSVIVFG